MSSGNKTDYTRPSEPRTTLTRRELEIAELIHADLTTGEIGLLLGISARTVEVHTYNIEHVLGLRSRLAIALWWERRMVAKAVAS